TVGDLTKALRDLDGIPVEQQRILYNGRELEEGRTLDQYQIAAGATLGLVRRSRSNLTILVPNGNVYPIAFGHIFNGTLGGLKTAIQYQAGILRNRQRLFGQDTDGVEYELLHDSDTLADLNIRKGSTLRVKLR
ncbi:hypothetical protein M408DRAFT_36611, partial [Serendipita vermifera MAFF 305830]